MELWVATLGGFTILGVLLTLAAWLNGRSTKRLIKSSDDATRELIKSENDATSELISRMDESTKLLLEKISQQIAATKKD